MLAFTLILLPPPIMQGSGISLVLFEGTTACPAAIFRSASSRERLSSLRARRTTSLVSPLRAFSIIVFDISTFLISQNLSPAISPAMNYSLLSVESHLLIQEEK